MSSANKQVSVTVSKNGPYIVAGDAPLTKQVIGANAEGDSLQWQEGKAYDTRPNTLYVGAVTLIRRRSATARTPTSALTAPKLQSAHPISLRQRYSTPKPCSSGRQKLLRGCSIL
jgi:hypothetical protein